MKLKFFLLCAFLCCTFNSLFAQLPSVMLKDMNGKTVNTATLSNDGKPFIVCFFATWCKPCNRELKAIHEVYSDWQDETGVKVIAISIDEGQNVQKVKPMVNAAGWEFQVLLDSNSDFRRSLGISLIPHTLIVDGAGNIVEQHKGYTEGGEEELITKVRSLIK